MSKQWRYTIPYMTRSQRVGILALSVLIIAVQIAYFVFWDWKYKNLVPTVFDPVWVNQQLILDSISSLSNQKTIYPFNPNFISDYKGYTLGMTLNEIDKLHAFRATNRYVNSALEFQQVTGVSDRWLDSISVYFKFPERKIVKMTPISEIRAAAAMEVVVGDINRATREDLMKLRGIGTVFSDRIITERDRLGGFVKMKQIEFIWGLSEESVKNLYKNFDVLEEVVVEKININTASRADIEKIPYLNYHIARSIVIYRSAQGDFVDFKEFENIVDFPFDKLEIISLYLAF